ncbi:hypothetical protein [Pelagerythrobacter marinus]|uniref:hypothetical protein n=1 Tax=Pelagerythrobacter marinus TaxID=538382 RepID=UPI002AC8E795|nr:hypothetical protein [Pelagerythrobacter marinus]WPZ05663.1 hypothetical protein T8T98_09495 [Pelagerythrobacter marinus]
MHGHNSQLPPLEEPCTACGGTGDAPPARPGEMQTSLNCATCKGHKVAPTAAGQQLLDFVQRRLGLSEKEAHRSMFG